MYKKDYTWNPSTYTCGNDKQFESIIDNSVATPDEVIEVAKTVPAKAISKTIPSKAVPIKAITTKTVSIKTIQDSP